MLRIDALHESMDTALQRLSELPEGDPEHRAEALVGRLELDLRTERRLLAELNLCIPGLSGVDPLAMLRQAEVDRLLAQLRGARDRDPRPWRAALVELRLQLDAAFVAVDLALPAGR